MDGPLDPTPVRRPLPFAEDLPASDNVAGRGEALETDASIFWWLFGTQVFAR